MKHSRLLIFDHLNLFRLIIAIFFRVFNYEILYLDLHGMLRDEVWILALKKWGIHIIEYDDFDDYDVKGLCCRQSELAKKVYMKLICHEKFLEPYTLFFGNIPDLNSRVRVTIKSLIAMFLGKLSDVCICAEYFSKSYEKVYIFSQNNIFVSMALEGERDKYKNLYPLMLGYSSIALKLVIVATHHIIRYALGFLRHRPLAHNDTSKDTREPDYAHCEVLYFPHQGIEYGKLFLKDHFYSDNPQSPFNKHKIVHIEYQKTERYQNIIDYYKKHDIPFCFIPRFQVKQLIQVCIALFGLIKKSMMYRELGTKNGQARILLVASIYTMYYKYYNFLLPFKRARIALIGYDMLFPKILSITLSSLGIVTVATQERLMGAYMRNFNVIVDYYYVIGDAVKEHLNQCDTSYARSVKPIGPIRLDSLHKYKDNSYLQDRYKELKRCSHIVIAYDYPSTSYKIDQYMDPTLTWENNKAFYRDLIKLALTFPEIYIIIRGKNDVWCSIPEFSDIYKIIMCMPNIEINRDYGELDVSSKLAIRADFLIAKHTSIGDEALAAGKPVLFYDYTPNIKKMFASVMDYDNYPVYVFSYDDLKARVERIIKNSDFMGESDFSAMRKRFYSTTAAGKVKERLHAELNALYKAQKVKDRK
ncbi:MAG: hypothetical protein ACMUJM_17190 [bacterium]